MSNNLNDDFTMQKNKWHLSSSISALTHNLLPFPKLFKPIYRFEIINPIELFDERLINVVFDQNNSHNETITPLPVL